ncbi:hypothetical protein AML91_00355 [Paenibacillus jilunlii]|uniref:Uncharacterized protein n=2 Tax=Paenibacillus jilunlii TaxID=682956 RepID=A0ABR5T1J6_9BACL|nr:hypothetical protein AML91_00355 [Paenibacillus jilunlii]
MFQVFLRKFLMRKAWYVLDEEKAHLHHQQHQPYTAVLTDDGQPFSTMIFGFKENGYIAMEKRDFSTGKVLERESQGSVDNNWTVVPEFGDYLYLCKEER